MERVLITGGCGFIGSHIAEKLLKLSYDIAVVDNLSTGSIDNIDVSAISFFQCDILDDRFEQAIAQYRPDYIIHQAAQANVSESVKNFLFDERVNIGGTLKVIELSRRYKIKKIVFASTSAVYGHPRFLPMDISHEPKPLSPYGTSKYTAELYLKLARNLYNIDFTVLRYGNVYGPRQKATQEGGVVSIFSTALTNGVSPAIFGDGMQTRDFVFVKDIVTANVQALKYGSGEILNVSYGTQISINELYRLIQSLTGSDLEATYKMERPGDVKHSLLCIKRTSDILNWQPKVDINEGLSKTLEYYR